MTSFEDKTIIPCSPDDISCTVAPDGKSITFMPCGVTSFNLRDVEERYCAACHRWMGLLEAAREIREKFCGNSADIIIVDDPGAPETEAGRRASRAWFEGIIK